MTLRTSLALWLFALLAPQTAGAADERPPWFHETLSLKGAAISAFLDSDIEYKGRDLDLESDLNLDDFSVLPGPRLHRRERRGRWELHDRGGVIQLDDDLIDEKFDIPFPTAGAYFDWAFSDRLALLSRFQYFGLRFQGVEGRLFRGSLRLQHRTFRNVDLFVGYDVLGANVNFDASFEWLGLVYNGPTLGAVLSF